MSHYFKLETETIVQDIAAPGIYIRNSRTSLSLECALRHSSLGNYLIKLSLLNLKEQFDTYICSLITIDHATEYLLYTSKYSLLQLEKPRPAGRSGN